MDTINAQTIIAAVLAAARVAPEYPDAAIDAAMPQGVPYGFEIVPDWEGTACRTYPPSSQYCYHNLAIERMQDAARAELRAMLDIPAFVRIRTSERGSMRIVNTSARLNQFAATVRTNARAFGGGLAPARRAPAAVKAWPAGPVKLVAELLQDNMPADATALALQRCGASFYDTGKGAFMVWAPMPVEGLPDGLISVRSSASGRYVVQCSKSGLSVGSTGATRRAAEESARQAVADAGPEKTAAAMAAARPCDIDAARAAWFKIHGIDAAAEVADMSETATPEPVADVAAEVSAFVASMAAIADAMQGPADAAPAVNPEPVAELAGHGAEVAPMMAGQAVASMPAAGGLADAGGSGPGWPAGPAAGRRVAGGSDAGPENAEPVGIAGTRGNSEGNPQPVGISDGRRFEVDGHDYRQAFENSDDAMRAAMGCVYLNPARFGFHSAELSRTGCTAWTYGFSTVQVRAVRADGVADGQAVTFNAARREWVGTATIDATEPAADVAPAADPEPVGIAYATGDGGQFTTSADACRHAANLANTSGLIVSVEAVQPAAPVEPVEISDVWGTDAEPHAIPGPDGNPVREWIRGAVCQVACAARISYRAAGIMAAPHAETLRAAHVAGASVHDGARIVLDASAGPADPQPVENVASEPAAVEPVEIADTGAEPGDDGAQPVEIPDYVGTGTYSPEDNKLRLYPFSRLDAATYARVKAAGFAWAPKQEVFVAPMWTPGRADLLAELVGQIEDEDGTMRERAADRADRFEDYQGKRAADAERARDAVQSIGARFEFGQPILIGHHSQRKAEKDKERMESGMRKAVQAWETSQYWERRAAACVRHALYKERPDVRARRIKGLESDLRKQERQRAAAVAGLARWEAVEIADKWKARADGTKPDRLERARTVAGLEHVGMYTPKGRSYAYSAYDVLQPDGERYADCESWTVDQVLEQVRRAYPIMIEWSDRWIQHYRNRIAYERAMLADAGGTVADKVGPEVGGACKCWASPRGGGWSTIQKVNRVSVTVLDNWGNGGADFTRTMPMDKLTAIMSRAQVDQARAEGRIVDETARGFHLLAPTPATPAADPVEIAQPVPDPAPEVAPAQPVENVAPAVEVPQEAPEPVQAAQVSPKAARLDAAPFQAMRQALKSGGVQAVAVPQLFATPAALAARMVELAQLSDGDRVLEPSAGTGRIVDAIAGRGLTGMIVAVEVSRPLADSLRARFETYSRPGLGIEVHAADFLQDMAIGRFDAVIMNPPFIGGADIKHIKRALQYLKPGGRLVAICAGGPRQAAELRPMVDAMGGTWEPLPADTFRESGTGVNTVLLCVEAPDVARQDPPEPVAKPEPMAKPAHMQPVKVADYRRAADHLMRLALSDYCACVNDGERQQWARIASRVMSEYDGMQCARASSQDVERFAQALEAVNSRLGKVSPEPVKNGPPVEEVKPAADLDAQLLAMRAAEAGPVPESLESLLRRYAAVRLVLYRASMQDERSAQIATQFACDDLMAQYRRTLREGGHEVDALAYVRMEAEDMERAARNTGLQASAPSASAAEPEPDPEAAPAVTIEAMHAFLALHYRPDRFTDRDGPTWGARYSWEVARSALEHLATHGHGQIGHHETRTGLSIHYDAALQVFDDAAMEPTTATAGQVQAWSARHFRAVLDWLEDMNHHGEALLIRALRAGSGSLAASVRGLIRDHLAAGYLRPELAARRNELAARVQALEAGR